MVNDHEIIKLSVETKWAFRKPSTKMQNAHTRKTAYTFFFVFYNWSTKKTDRTVFQNRTRGFSQNRTETEPNFKKSIPHIPRQVLYMSRQGVLRHRSSSCGQLYVNMKHKTNRYCTLIIVINCCFACNASFTYRKLLVPALACHVVLPVDRFCQATLNMCRPKRKQSSFRNSSRMYDLVLCVCRP